MKVREVKIVKEKNRSDSLWHIACFRLFGWLALLLICETWWFSMLMRWWISEGVWLDRSRSFSILWISRDKLAWLRRKTNYRSRLIWGWTSGDEGGLELPKVLLQIFLTFSLPHFVLHVFCIAKQKLYFTVILTCHNCVIVIFHQK